MLKALNVGDKFHDRFEIMAFLGAGAMGSVYLARQLDANRLVALKILQLQGFEQQTGFERFLREFRLLAGLSHENIVTFYSAALTPEGTLYAVCEYLEGKSLQQLLAEEKKIPWSRLAPIAVQICNAMDCAHSRSIIHRDLKPANIILVDKPERDTVKIIDFGLAKLLAEARDSAETATGPGIMLGTPHYMSAEQAVGRNVDHRSDIYSLGCILFECLTGKKLFQVDSVMEILARLATESPEETISKSFSDNSPLSELLSKMLAKDFRNRYQSMDEVRTAILSIGSDNPESTAAAKLKPSLKTLVMPALIVIALGILFICFREFAPNRSAPLKTSSAQADEGLNSLYLRLRELPNPQGYSVAVDWLTEGYKKSLDDFALKKEVLEYILDFDLCYKMHKLGRDHLREAEALNDLALNEPANSAKVRDPLTGEYLGDSFVSSILRYQFLLDQGDRLLQLLERTGAAPYKTNGTAVFKLEWAVCTGEYAGAESLARNLCRESERAGCRWSPAKLSLLHRLLGDCLLMTEGPDEALAEYAIALDFAHKVEGAGYRFNARLPLVQRLCLLRAKGAGDLVRDTYAGELQAADDLRDVLASAGELQTADDHWDLLACAVEEVDAKLAIKIREDEIRQWHNYPRSRYSDRSKPGNRISQKEEHARWELAKALLRTGDRVMAEKVRAEALAISNPSLDHCAFLSELCKNYRIADRTEKQKILEQVDSLVKAHSMVDGRKIVALYCSAAKTHWLLEDRGAAEAYWQKALRLVKDEDKNTAELIKALVAGMAGCGLSERALDVLDGLRPLVRKTCSERRSRVYFSEWQGSVYLLSGKFWESKGRIAEALQDYEKGSSVVHLPCSGEAVDDLRPDIECKLRAARCRQQQLSVEMGSSGPRPTSHRNNKL
jgi:serine/threonine protein kinase